MMRRAWIGVYLIIFYIMISADLSSVFAARQKTTVIDVPVGIQKLDIQNNVGNIFISGGSKKIFIKIHKLKFTDKKCVIENSYDPTTQQQTIVIKKKSSFGPQKCQVKMVIQVPAAIDLRIVNGVGSINIDRISSQSVDYKVGSGAVKIKGLKSDKLSGKVGAGKLDILKSDINEAQLSYGSGNMKLDANLQKLSLDIGSGNVEVQTVKSHDSLDYDIRLGVGNANIALPAKTKLQSSLLTGRGRAKSLFKEVGQVANSSLSVRTGIGDIVVRKSK